MSTLDRDDITRYSRHLVLDEIGRVGQERLKSAKVLIVGAGGLGSPISLYLAAAGVGTIGILDHDKIDLSNLQRQILFNTNDVGKSKSLVACEKLKLLNPLVELRAYNLKIDASNAIDLISQYDLVMDGTDNFPTRYLLNDACVLADKTMIYGSILRFEGQVSVLNCPTGQNTRSTNYRDLFPEPPQPDTIQNCEQAGVIGALPGIIGSIQASEAVKIITGAGQPLVNKLLIFDALTVEQTIINIPNRNARNNIKSLIDYEDFCGLSQQKDKYLAGNQPNVMKEVTVQELKKLKDTGADFQLIDVREPHEFDICNIDGELIPMSEIPYNVDKIAKDKQVVIHCRSGKRSGDMLLWLEKNHGFTNLYNLKGGILAWAKEIDPEMPQY